MAGKKERFRRAQKSSDSQAKYLSVLLRLDDLLQRIKDVLKIIAVSSGLIRGGEVQLEVGVVVLQSVL